MKTECINNVYPSQQRLKKGIWIASLSLIALLCILIFGVVKTEAKTIVIRTPKQLKNINWKSKGFGPGTYKIGNDMTLGDGDDATCVLTKGKFVIDLNGHTVQNANNALTVFHVAGADVVIMDSKAKKGKPGVRSYGAGAVQITSGKLTIKNGNYAGLSDGTNNPGALHVGGGTCTVNKGTFFGEYIGASVMGGKLTINNGTFRAGYAHALLRMGAGKISIKKGTFQSGTTTYGFRLALGSYIGNGETKYSAFNNWLAKGSYFSPKFQTGYWNMQSSVTEYPTYSNLYAVSWDTPTLRVKAK